jgi:hypothetical protein
VDPDTDSPQRVNRCRAFASHGARGNTSDHSLCTGQVIAASKGNHGGRPKVIDDDMLTFAVALKDKGVPVPDIAKKLTIKTGKNAGKPPSVASLYRALAEAEAAAADDGLPLRPKPVRIRRPEDPLTPEEIGLRERLQAQPHPNAELR